MKNSHVVNLSGFADIDVPVIEGNPINESEESEMILVNPCTGLVVHNANKGNLIDVGGNVFGSGCEELMDSSITLNEFEELDSTSIFEDSTTSTDSIDTSCTDDGFDSFTSGFDDFC